MKINEHDATDATLMDLIWNRTSVSLVITDGLVSICPRRDSVFALMLLKLLRPTLSQYRRDSLQKQQTSRLLNHINIVKQIQKQTETI